MGIRLTGVSTPIGGASWEFTKPKKESAPSSIVPDSKIKVFLSSICGNEKYNNVRADLKKAIEKTQLADVYTFESEGASTLTSGAHYTFALEDSDICIFFIDNADGVTSGVQVEVDTVKKHNIKSLYYFCDENSKERTALEQSLMGASFAKSTTVHKFEDLSLNGARDLIKDIINIYHYYCKGKLVLNSQDYNNDYFESVSLSGIEKMTQPTVPKAILKNIDKCKDYILKVTIANYHSRLGEKIENTNKIDEWGVRFLPVLFEARSIKHFNTGMYLDTLKNQQTKEYHQIVEIRWQAIQAYFLGDVGKCVEYMNNALKVAKESNQPAWVVKDILIDMRNQELVLNDINNCYSESKAQKELTDSSENVHYPILDRVQNSLHEKYIEGLFKKKIESPYTVSIGNNLDEYGEFLASSYIIAIYNGSLTHILSLYRNMKYFLFYLSCKYNNWTFRRDMFKFVIYIGKAQEIKSLQHSYPEILNNMGAEDAAAIMTFCNNHPVKYKRLNSQLLAFGAVGYYLNDKHFDEYATLLVSEIKNWLNDEHAVVAIGQSIFKCLSGVSLRLSQEALAEICCLFIDKHYLRWYKDMFKFIEYHIDLHKMTVETSKVLLDHLIGILKNEKDCDQVKNAPSFLCVLRKQEKSLTKALDQVIAKYMPNYYNGDYKLETTENKEKDFPEFIQNYVIRIQKSNNKQGKNRSYFCHGTRDIAIIRWILLKTEFELESEIIDSIITTVAQTLLKSKESISIKLDAISLLICIAVKYPMDFQRNRSMYEQIFDKQDEIDCTDVPFISYNIDHVSLKIGLQLLFTAIGCDTYPNILELMPYIQNNTATIISVTNLIIEYLELADDVILPNKVESIILQNVLQWVHSDNINIRWNATRILLTMLRNPENENVVNHELLSIVDSDNFYIKNLIMRNVLRTNGIFESTKQYVISKCQNDTNYVVRMACEEESKKQR